MDEFVQTLNSDTSTPGEIVLEYIDERLTSVMQVCDIVINKPFKTKVRTLYNELRWKTRSSVAPSHVFKVTRAQLIEIIERSVSEINEENRQSRTIAKGFRSCGQDIWNPDPQLEFEQRLASLSLESVYSALTQCTKAMHLQ